MKINVQELGAQIRSRLNPLAIALELQSTLLNHTLNLQMTIYHYPWYFGEMDRKEAMLIIESEAEVNIQLHIILLKPSSFINLSMK